MKQLFPKFFLFSAVLFLSMGGSALPRGSVNAAQQPTRVLILTGQNNHDWRTTTPQLREILMRDGRFTVEISEHPEKLDDSAKEKYDLLLSNWNSWGDSGVKEWSSATRDAFLEFVREGRGLVVVHAGSSSFMDWDDYQNLVGGTWGKETGHGAVHTFTVRLSDTDHLITRGLESFQITDELWHRVPLRSVTVLATAFSAADKGGSGKDEPVAFTTSFGKGRCFNLVLGHDVGAMKAPGFQILLRRGAEWAARNAVTIPAKPSDDQALLQCILREAESYQFSQSRTSLMRVESLVASAGVRGGAPILAKALASKLKSTSASPDAKRFFCEQLSLIGTEAEVPTVAAVLSDTNLFYEAAMALQRIPGDEARAALLKGVSSASVPQQVVIINALAARGDPESASRLTELARSDDAAVSTAALRALGRINGEAGLNALSELESTLSASNRPALRRAQLSVARMRVEAGDMDSVRPLLKKLLADTEPVEIQAGALLLDATVPESSTEQRLLDALRSRDPALRAAGVGGLKLEKNRAALLTAARELAGLPKESQLVLLTALDEVRAKQALPQVLDLLRSGGVEVRPIALDTLASLGNESAVDPLVQLLPEASSEEKQQIVSTLARLPGANVDQALADAFKSAEAASKPSLVEAMVARSPAGLPEFLLDALESPDPQVRVAVLAGLEKVGTLDSAPGLLRQLQAASEAEASMVESALAQIYRREGKLQGLEEQLARGDASTKSRLLNVAAAVGGPETLRLIQREARSQDPGVALTALRVLAEWPDADAFDGLSSIAVSTKDTRSRSLAIRGLVRLAPQVKQDPGAAAQSLSRMLPQANVSEKKQLLSALGQLSDGAGLEILRNFLDDPDAGAEARLAAVKALEAFQPGPNDQAKRILNTLKQADPEPTVKDRLQVLDWKFSDLPNLSPSATATSTTGLGPDGQGGSASAAIDGNLQTYWDETDNQKLYALKIELKKPAQIGFLRICGWKHHEYAPKDFEILCDGKSAAKVESAQYVNNWFTVVLNGTECQVIELRIHGYYAASPAIRELEIRGKIVQTNTNR